MKKIIRVLIIVALANSTALAETVSSMSQVSQENQKTVQSIQKKVTELQSQMQKISEVPTVMQEFEPLMKQQKFNEAEAVVDRAIQKLKDFKALPVSN